MTRDHQHNPDTTPPHRRWFQFSLRTMFVVVAAFAVFVAYHVNWIRQRHDFLQSLRGPAPRLKPILWDGNYPTTPGLLWLFGEEACWGIDLSSED